MGNVLSRFWAAEVPVDTKDENWDCKDVWSKIAQSLHEKEIMSVASTCKWFHRILRMEYSIWKYACLKDLQIPEPELVQAIRKFGSLSYPGPPSPIEMRRIGFILFDSSMVMLVHDLEVCRRSTVNETLDALFGNANSFVVQNVKTGLWIVDWQLGRDIYGGGKTHLVLQAQHAESFLNELLLKEEASKNRISEFAVSSQMHYDDVLSVRIKERVKDTSSAIFDMRHLRDDISEFFKTESWVVCEPFKSRVVDHLLPTSRKTLHAAAYNCILDADKGIDFGYMVHRAKTGEAVKIKLMTVTRY